MRRQPRMRLKPHRLVFLDEAGPATRMIRLRGRCLKSQRLALRQAHRPLCRQCPDESAYLRGLCRKKLAATFAKGDTGIVGNLPARKSKVVEDAIKASCSRSFRPTIRTMEITFARPKLVCRQEPPGLSMPWQETGRICTFFAPEECQNYFAAAEYPMV
ncbi:MAG TPA: hypothetical protein VEK34_03300 [Methylocella sp.]|nr:hypothetical protein [Methylocella sp.]